MMCNIEEGKLQDLQTFLENLLEYHTSWDCSHHGVRNVSLGRNAADFLWPGRTA